MTTDDTNSSLEGAIASAIKSDEAKVLVAEYAQAGIDAVLKDGVLKEIPIAGTVIGLLKVGQSVRNRVFMRKLLELMSPLSQVDPRERTEMIDRLESDRAYGRRVGEHLTEIVDRIELHRKPRMVAAVFLGYQRNIIDATMLHRLIFAIDRLPSFAIDSLRPFCEAPERERSAPLPTLWSLLASGLLNAVAGYGGMVFEPNDVASEFLRLELDRAR